MLKGLAFACSPRYQPQAIVPRKHENCMKKFDLVIEIAAQHGIETTGHLNETDQFIHAVRRLSELGIIAPENETELLADYLVSLVETAPIYKKAVGS